MAQIIDVKGYGPVEFPDGMSQEDMFAALQKLPPRPSAPTQQTQATTSEALPLTPQQRERIAADETAYFSKPAFVAPKQRAVALQERAARVKEEDAAKYAYKDLYTNTELLNKLTAYGGARLGKNGLPKEKESPQEYVDRVVSHIRSVTEDPNPIKYTSEREWINNSKPEDVVKAGEAYDILQNTASFLDPRGQSSLTAFKDYAGLMLSNPLTYGSLGVGKVATSFIAKEAAKVGIKKALTSKLGATAVAAPLGFEGGSGAVTNAYKQKREIDVAAATAIEMGKILPTLPKEDQDRLAPKLEALNAKVDKGISVSEALTMGAIQAPFGLLETAPLLLAATKGTKFLKGDNLTLKDLTDARKQQLATSKKPATLTGDEAADNVSVTTTNIYDGGDLLDMQGSPTSIAQMQVKNSIDKQADLIAASIWKQIPEYAPKAGEKTFEAVQRTLDSFDKLPDNVIKQSMADAGTDLPNFMTRLSAAGLDEDALKKFSSMYGVSTSDAARTLQSKSVISRMLNKMKEVDPEASKAVDALFGKKASMGPILDGLGAFKGWLDKVDRNMITAMTTNMSTVMRNAFGVGVNLTYGAAEEGLESLIFNTGRKIAGKMRGSPVAGDIGKGFNGVIDDTVSGYFYLGQGDLSREITEEALKNNPMLMSKMLATAEDMKNSDLIKPIRILNTPAVIMDNYVRRAIFSASIDNNLRKAGLNLVDLIAQDKNIPIDVLRQGVDDALTFTFSKTPTEGMGLAFVKGVEAARPISTAVFPFARFLVNATQWTAKHYNPWYAGKGAAEALEGVRLLKNGDEAGSKLLLQGSERIAQQATGMATLLAAYAYRKENQDSPWNVMKSDDGTNVDIKYLFPMNVPFALADFYYKIGNGNPEDFKAMDLVEALTGFKAVGSTSESLERIKEVVSSMFATGEKETDQSALNKVSRSYGDLIGAWLGRATVPLNQVSDIISAFDSNEALPRDIYVTKPEEDRTFLTAVGKNIQKGIPLLKQALPEYQPATRTQAPFRDTGPLKQMTGLALVPPKNAIETEIEARKIPFNKIFSTTGDKTVDAEARRFMANNIDNFIPPIINMDDYKKATDEGKAIQLTNALSDLQSKAKEVAKAQSIEQFYNMKKVPPIQQKEFEALPPKLRRVTLDFYKQNKGTSFESDTDFMKYGVALEMSKELKKNAIAVQKPTEKATGGVVGYQVGGLAAKQIAKEVGSSAVMKSSMSLLKEMQDAAAKAAVKEAPTEIIPTPVVKEGAASAMAKIPYNKNKYSSSVSKPVDAEMEKLVSDAEASFTPPPKMEPEVVPEIKTELPVEAAVPMSPFMKGIVESDLNKAKYGFSRDSDIISDFEVRQNTLTAIKQIRTDTFDKLIEMPNVAGKVEDDVIAVAQGEYRAAKGKEVDVNDPKAVADFVSFSLPLQDKLNKLREKYKDRQPKVLYHGTEDNAAERATKGFFDPQTLPEATAGQRELKVGATSFTDDARFNYSTSFGGVDPENIVQTTIPYADYEFRRINMARDQYKKNGDMGDMNIIARSITGSPTVARPLGLPRSIGMRESEDAFTESEKLVITRNMYETEKKIPLFKQQEDIRNNSYKNLKELRNNFLSPKSLKPIKEGGLGSEEVQALKAYRLIRGLVRNEFRETGGKAAIESGLTPIVTSNQTTASRLNRLARPSYEFKVDLSEFIPNIIESLEKIGSKDKAESLKVLQEQFNLLLKQNIGMATSNAEMSSAVKRELEAVNNIRDLVGGSYKDKETKKRIGLARGGLASRR